MRRLQRVHLPRWGVTQDLGLGVRLPQPDAHLLDLMLTSSKGMPQCFIANQGRKLQEDRFLSPITRV
jgi:hypothetical protein